MGAPTPPDRHPLAPLSDVEFRAARDAVLAVHGTHPSALLFRTVQLEEPPKAELVPFLIAEHAGELTETTPRPPRRARVQYDVISARQDGNGSVYKYTQCVIDLETSKEVSRDVTPEGCHSSYVTYAPDLADISCERRRGACMSHTAQERVRPAAGHLLGLTPFPRRPR